MKEMDQFTITLDPKQTLKSTWKKEVKEKITRKMGDEIREKCKNSKKARIVQHDLYQRKDYLNGKASLKETQNILRTRMNMIKIPGNYKGSGDGWCPLCEETEGSTEHYFECSKVQILREVWEVKREDLTTKDVKKMKAVSSFMEKVEILIQPNDGYPPCSKEGRSVEEVENEYELK